MSHTPRTLGLTSSLLLACLLHGTPASASTAETATDDPVRVLTADTEVEYSMQVAGTIEIDAAGKVLRHSFDQRRHLPAPLVNMLDGRIPAWRFAPMALPESQSYSALRMRLRVIAERVGEERDMFRMTVRDAAFLLRDDPRPETDLLSFDPRSRLQAPDALYGTVYLAVRIGPDGVPLEVFPQRVDLTVEGSEKQMSEWRKALASFTERQSSRLRFKVPTTGPQAGQSEWTGLLPVAYVRPLHPKEWEWQVYYPGPETAPPWKAADAEAIPSDLLPLDTTETPEQARRLLTPLDAN